METDTCFYEIMKNRVGTNVSGQLIGNFF